MKKLSAIVVGTYSTFESCLFVSILHSANISGAGTGGVATAARLGQLGFQVTVVEKNDYIGGRCSPITKDGYLRIPMASHNKRKC